MARKRMIDPEFWSDEEIGQWSFQARLFYIGLWNFADDEGRFKANDTLTKAQIFPYDAKNVSMKRLRKETASKIQYYSVNNSQYGFIRNFLKYQRIDRPTLSKLPKPPIDEPSTSPREHLDPNIIEVNISKEKLKIGVVDNVDNLKKGKVLLHSIGVKEPDNKTKHLNFVFLTLKEHQELILKYGKTYTKSYIEKLNAHIGSKGAQYKSHYHTILSWLQKDNVTKKWDEF